MSLPVSEKNFLEKVAARIPGIAGYREREARRETDRRLREYLAGRLEDGRRHFDGLRRTLLDAGLLPALDAVGRLDRTLQRSAAALRYADYGYSGLFDQVKIREEELGRIYAFDEALLDRVHELADAIARSASAPDADAIADLAARAEALDRDIARRREIFQSPQP
jgi:hypothetical protein